MACSGIIISNSLEFRWNFKLLMTDVCKSASNALKMQKVHL